MRPVEIFTLFNCQTSVNLKKVRLGSIIELECYDRVEQQWGIEIEQEVLYGRQKNIF